MHRRSLTAAACFAGVAATITILFLQWAIGSWNAGWSAQSDSPAHLVSSLVIRQYVLDGLPSGQPPVEFAYSFYHRFPKVALGHWPPVLHSALALWLLVGPLHPVWILGFQAVSAGLLAALTTLLAGPLLGRARAILCALLTLLTPPLIVSECLVMADVVTAIFVVCGLLAFHRFWRRPSLAASLMFGFSLAAALLTKPSGAILALFPFFAVLFFRRWSMFSSWSFWLLFVPALVLYAPWHFYFLNEIHDGWSGPRRHISRFLLIPSGNLRLLARTSGYIGLPLALWGAWKCRRGRWWLLSCCVLASFLFLSFIAPSIALRHYSTVAPAVTILALGGIRAISRRSHPLLEPAGWLLLIGGLFFAAPLPVLDYGARPLVARLLQTPAPQTWLVAGDPSFEGDIIAEAALRRPSSGLTVYRATKLITSSAWSGRNPKPLVHSTQETLLLLDRCSISTVILGPRAPRILVDSITASPSRWKLSPGSLPASTGSVYQRLAPPPPGLGPPVIQIP